MSYFYLILILSTVPGLVYTAEVEREHGKLDVAKLAAMSTFYNLKTNQTLGTKNPSKLNPLALTNFSPLCDCNGPQCTCCAGIRIIGLGFNREACAVLTYQPVDAKVDLELRLNNKSVYKNQFTSTNQQLCLPVIPITLTGPVEWCVKLQETRVVNQILHTCIVMLVRIANYNFLTLQFTCLDMGEGSFGVSRPGLNGPDSSFITKPEANATNIITQSPQLDSDVYNDVSANRVKLNTTTQKDPRDN